MTNNAASSFHARVNGKHFEGTSGCQDIQDAGTHLDGECSGGWTACDRRCESRSERRTIIGVVYFFANHSLWKTPIVYFLGDGGAEQDCTQWRIAVAGLGWRLGIDEYGTPTLFLDEMANDGMMTDAIGIKSKRKPTPIKLFGFTIVPQRNDRVRTLVPYFTSKVCSSTVQGASKFQKLCPRANRKPELDNNITHDPKSEKKESVLVPADPEYYIEKNPSTKATMRLCGVSFITPLSVSDEFAFVNNPTRKNNQLTGTKTNSQPCQNVPATCLPKSIYIEPTGVKRCDNQLGIYDKNITIACERDKCGGKVFHSVNECVFTSGFSTDPIKAFSNKLIDREHSGNLTSIPESNLRQSSGHLCNVVTSNDGCRVSYISDSLSKNIPRTSSESILCNRKNSMTELGSSEQNTNISCRNQNSFGLPLTESVAIRSYNCGNFLEDDSPDVICVDKNINFSFRNNVLTADRTKSVDECNENNDYSRIESYLRDKKASNNTSPLYRPYSQTKFPLDVICSGKIGQIKTPDTFINSSQPESSLKRFSVGDYKVADKYPIMYPQTRSFSAGKVELMKDISSIAEIGVEYCCHHTDYSKKQYSKLSDGVDKNQTDIGSQHISEINSVNITQNPNNLIESSGIESQNYIVNKKWQRNILPTGYISDENQRPSLDVEKNNNQSSALVHINNSKQEDDLIIFNLKNNSLENFLKTYHNTTESDNCCTNESIIPSVCIAPVCTIDIKSHMVPSDRVLNNCLNTASIDEEHSSNFNETEATLNSANTRDESFIHSSTDAHKHDNVIQSNSNSSTAVRKTFKINNPTTCLSTDDTNPFGKKIDKIKITQKGYLNSVETSSIQGYLVKHNGVHDQTNGSIADKERDDPVALVVKSAESQPNINIDKECSNYDMDKIPFGKPDIVGALPHTCLEDNSDAKWIPFIEQIMLDIFNWPKLSALVAERENGLSCDFVHLGNESFHDSSFLHDVFDDSSACLNWIHEPAQNLSVFKEETNQTDSFNDQSFEDDIDAYFEEKISDAYQRDSNNDSFFDTICISEQSLMDEKNFHNDESCVFDSSEFLDCVQQTPLLENNNDDPLLQTAFNPNREEFYQNYFKSADLHPDFNDKYSFVSENVLDEGCTQSNQYSAQSADLVWGFEQGPVGHRGGGDANTEWPSVWKPPEYESDQSGYETDEELDNMDEEMLRLEEKLRKFEEELGMSTDDSIGDSNTDEEILDIKKYFPLKSSYSTSHLDKAKRVDKKKAIRKNDNCTAENEKTSSNDLLFLSGAGFKCGDRRCFSASLAQDSTQAAVSTKEMNKDLFNKPVTRKRSFNSNLSNNSESKRLVEEEQSCFSEEEVPLNDLNLLHEFSDGHLWYENGMALIDFDNLCMVEDTLTSNVLFFIFEDEILEDLPHDDYETKEFCANYTSDPSCIIDDDAMQIPSMTPNVHLDSNLIVENSPEGNLYNPVFLQDNYLDTLPCIIDDGNRSNYVQTAAFDERDNIGQNSVSKQPGNRPANSCLLPDHDIISGREHHPLLYDNKLSPIEGSNGVDWKKMSSLYSNQSYAVDRSSTVGHISSDMSSKTKNSAIGEREDVLDSNIFYHAANCFDADLRYRLHDQSEMINPDIDAAAPSADLFGASNTITDLPEDYNSHTTVNYPQRPERTKNRRPSQNTSSLGCDGTSTSGNNHHGHANHQRAHQARHSRHRRK